MLRFGIGSSLADRKHGPLDIVHKAPARQRDLGALLDFVDDARFVLQHAGELLGVFRKACALHALMLQIRVETKALCRQRFARNLGHRAQHRTRLLKGEAGIAFGARQWHQRQGSAHFDTQSAAVAKKQTREVRAKVPHKRRRVLLARRAGLDQFAFPRDHAH